MGTENRYRTCWNLVEVTNKNRALSHQIFNDMGIMDDFMENKNRRPELVQGLFHYIDSPDDTRAETSWLG
jgi:hypothetical protein